MKNSNILVALVVALLGLSACRYDMQDQPKYEPYEGSEIFKDTTAGRAPVQGTVARGFLHDDIQMYQGKTGTTTAGDPMSGFVTAFPFPITQAVIDRGEQRFNIYCSPCHGKTGAGDGMIAQRGFRTPPSYHIDRLRNAPVGYIFDVITNGFGVMPDYSQQVAASDRWAIVAYVRALQLSTAVKSTDLSPEDIQKLNAPPAPAKPAHYGADHNAEHGSEHGEGH